jgi:signal transduction histidine kinase
MGISYAASAPTDGGAGEADQAVETQLSGRWLTVARAVWVVVATLFLLTFAAGVIATIVHAQVVCPASSCPNEPPQAFVRHALKEAGLSYGFFLYYNLVVSVIFAVPFAVVALLLFWRRSDDGMALFTSLALLGFGLVTFSPIANALIDLVPATRWAVAPLIIAGSVAFFVFLYIFPTGRFAPRWTIVVAIIWSLQQFAQQMFPSSPLNTSVWPLFGQLVIWTVFLGSVIYSQIYRFRRLTNEAQRQQTKWVVYGVTAALIGYYVNETALAFIIGDVNHLTANGLRAALISTAIAYLALMAVPLSIGVAILRYRLFDVDLLINRTLVYGALTVCVIGLYVLIVGGFSVVFQSEGNPVVALLATGVVAVAVQPLQQRLQHAANRLIYGQRDAPYTVLSELGRRLEATLAPDATLPVIVETAATALKLSYVAIALGQGKDATIAASYGTLTCAPLRQPLLYQGDVVGELILSPRAPSGDWMRADRLLLSDIGRQAGIAAHAVLLNAELKRARERLVLAREEERRRLRRDLHDGLGPQLASQALTLTAASRLLRQDPDAAENLLREAISHAQSATADIRRVVYGLRPPALDDLGLIGALQEQAAQYCSSGMTVTVSAPDTLPPLPAAVEVALYRIAQEAMTNVARHAQASRCVVALAVGETLALEITDNGVGIPPDQRAGVGLNSMRERTEELGGLFSVSPSMEGGARVVARLPLA